MKRKERERKKSKREVEEKKRWWQDVDFILTIADARPKTGFQRSYPRPRLHFEGEAEAEDGMAEVVEAAK